MTIGKKNALTGIVGFVTVLISCIIYMLLPYEKADIDFLSLFSWIGSILIAVIAILFLGNLKINRHMMMTAGIWAAAALYVGLTAISSLFFVILYRSGYGAALIVHVVLFAGFLLTAILLYFIGSSAAENATHTLRQMTEVKLIENNISMMKDNPKNRMHMQGLNQIYEGIVSFDQSVTLPTDDEIVERIGELNQLLQSNTTEINQVQETVNEVLQLIKKRNLEVQQMKLGGI